MKNYLSFLCVTLNGAVGIAAALCMGLGLYAESLGDYQTGHILMGAPFLAIIPMMLLGCIGAAIDNRL